MRQYELYDYDADVHGDELVELGQSLISQVWTVFSVFKNKQTFLFEILDIITNSTSPTRQNLGIFDKTRTCNGVYSVFTESVENGLI